MINICNTSLSQVLKCVCVTALLLLPAGCINTGGLFQSEKPGTEERTDAGSRISIVINDLGMTFPAGLDENNNPYLSYIEEHTKLDVQVTIPPKDVYEEKLNVIMASGSTPDMINYSEQVWMNNYAKQDKLMPLDDLIDRFGPDLKKNIPKEAWDRVTVDGKIYAIPSLNTVKGLELMYVRKDWLDRLGLKPPVTLDEYYEVIRAFTQDDPDGNGVDDTIGLTFSDSLGRTAPFFGAFGVQLDQWMDRYGDLVYSSILPETKEALAFLNKLYKEKLLDTEFPLNRYNSMIDKIISGKVGLFSATWYDTRGPIAANKKRDPRAVWIPLEYPVGPYGDKGVYATELIRSYNVIPAQSKQAAGVIRFLNFMAEDGYRDLKLGFENEVWRMENGKMITDFVEHDKHLYRGMYQSLIDLEKPDISKQRLDSLGDFQLYENLMRIEDNLIPNAFYGSPTPAMSKYVQKQKELREKFVLMIMGVKPLDQFDGVVEQWMKEGGDEMTQEVNEWYRAPGRAQGD
ncbi:extracellular solute-binding protein [Paenibacillus sp. FJAT-26967]|uniref:extracellular solute-binding protein n=1 Tax=Paenibacillus sp. FJAT-26967 TaxID=1729690 RepID=UPI000838DC22|nr:extracellular solute-binding protein [Paenibacillus sp. FJAT-26967]